MGLFDKFKKKSGDDLDSKIAEMQAKNAGLKAQKQAEADGGNTDAATALKNAAQAAEAMNAFSAELENPAAIKSEPQMKLPAIMTRRIGSLDTNSGVSVVYGTARDFSPVIFIPATGKFGQINWGPLGNWAIQKGINQREAGVVTTNIHFRQQVGKSNLSDGKTAIFGIGEDYSPIYLCMETGKSVNFSWSELAEFIVPKLG